MPFQRGFAPADQPVLIGDDLYKDPVPHPGVTNKRLDVRDLHGSFERRAAPANQVGKKTMQYGCITLIASGVGDNFPVAGSIRRTVMLSESRLADKTNLPVGSILKLRGVLPPAG